jgi:hypothetical protein
MESSDNKPRLKIVSSRWVPPRPICGLLSITTPLIGGLLFFSLVNARIGEAIRQHQIAHPGAGFSINTGDLYLAMAFRVLIPTPIIGIGFGVLGRKRREAWVLPIVGFYLNLVAILFLIVLIVVIKYLSYMAW